MSNFRSWYYFFRQVFNARTLDYFKSPPGALSDGGRRGATVAAHAAMAGRAGRSAGLHRVGEVRRSVRGAVCRAADRRGPLGRARRHRAPSGE